MTTSIRVPVVFPTHGKTSKKHNSSPVFLFYGCFMVLSMIHISRFCLQRDATNSNGHRKDLVSCFGMNLWVKTSKQRKQETFIVHFSVSPAPSDDIHAELWREHDEKKKNSCHYMADMTKHTFIVRNEYFLWFFFLKWTQRWKLLFFFLNLFKDSKQWKLGGN